MMQEKKGDWSLEQTRQMFMDDSEMAKENRQKLCLLCSMDYNIYVMDEEKQESRQLEAEKGGSLGENDWSTGIRWKRGRLSS